jgi:Holliday junction resolvase-like predicted endonuclease
MAYKQQLGAQGEATALAWLERQGYQRVATRWRLHRLAEVDIICVHPSGQALCFTEVKTRRPQQLASAWHALTPTKKRRLVQAVTAYQAEATKQASPHAHLACQVDWLIVTALPQLSWQHWPVTLVEQVLYNDGACL